MESEHFLEYLQKTKQLEKIEHINSDGTPNMKHKYIRDLYHKFLYHKTPSFECSICLEEINDNMCKLKCGHEFCVDCFSNLTRTSNNCALCRKEISTACVKKEINTNRLIDMVDYEMNTELEDRDNLSLCEFIHNQVNRVRDTTNISDYILNRVVHTILMEVHDSLHYVGTWSMESMI